MQQRLWFITGIGTGLGRELAKAVLDAGDAVIGTTQDGRSELSGADLLVLKLDVTDAAQVRSVVAEAHGWRGRINILVNNAGLGVFGSVEETSEADALKAFDVNFHGPRRVLQAALPLMRPQLTGHVVNIASVAAADAQTGSAVYAAAKAGVLALSEALLDELKPFQLKVTAVLPGSLRTAFLDRPDELKAAEDSPYVATAGAALKHFAAAAGKQPGDPARAAATILEAVNAEQSPLYLLLGEDAVRRVRAKIDRLRVDIDHWDAASTKIGFKETPAHV